MQEFPLVVVLSQVRGGNGGQLVFRGGRCFTRVCIEAPRLDHLIQARPSAFELCL